MAAEGFFPITLDNLTYGHKWAVKWGPLIKSEIQDYDVLDQIFETYKPIAVLHFAAFAYVGESVVNPAVYYRNNVSGSISLLEAMRVHECHNIVFSSTCATYGNPQDLPISENHSQNPINPYGRSKWMIEQILRDFDNAYGFKYVSLRYFNAAGADPDGELGEDHNPETHIIPLAIYAALGLRPCVEIFGTDYSTHDGTAIRDYTHVTDLADAHVLALRHLLEGKESMSINLGTGIGHSVRDVIHAVECVSNRPVPVHESNRRTGDPPILVAESSMAVEKLGWQPNFKDLQTIVNTAFQWHYLQEKEVNIH